MSIIEKFIKSTGVIGAANAAIAIKSLVLIPIIVKNLGEGDFGIWAQLIVTLYLFIPFATLHLGIAFVRFNSAVKNNKDLSKNFTTVLIIVVFWSMFISLLFYFTAKFVLGLFIDLTDFEQYLPLLGLVLPLWSVNLLLFSYFKTTLQFNKYALFTVVQNVTDLVLIGFFIFLGWRIYGAMTGLLLNFAIINLIMFMVIMVQIGLSKPDYAIITRYISFSLPLVPLELFWWVADSSDKYITGFYLGATAVGIYAAVYGLSRIVNMFVQPLNFVLSPTLAKFYDNGRMAEVKKLLSLSLKIFLMFAIPLVVGFTVLSKPMLLVLASQEVADNGAYLVPLITGSMLLYGYGTIYGQIINLIKKTQIAGAIWGGAAAINIIFNILLIPRIGITGPAISTFFTFGFATAVIVMYTKKQIHIPFDTIFIFKCVISASAMGVILYYLLPLLPHNLLITITLILLGIGVYFALMVASGAIGTQEKEFLAGLMFKKSNP